MTPYDAGKPLTELAAELGLPELVRLYPDGGAVALRDALARRLGVRPGQLVVGNGADELIGLVALAAFDPGDEVVVPQPSFEPYATSVVLAGARAVLSPLAGYETDLDDIRRKVSGRTKAVMLCSPHNPTATIIRKAPLLAFLDALGADPPLVVLDEAYYDFADDPEYPNGVALLARYPRLIVLRTFSKIAGLAGLLVRDGADVGFPGHLRISVGLREANEKLLGIL